jgi:tetratricopeptide (TPR) repeat protein
LRSSTSQIANLLKEHGDPSRAEQLYRAALVKRPGFAEARYNLALLLNQLNRFDEAQAELEQVVAERPAFPGARLILGAALAKQGRAAEAADTFRKQIELAPNDADARFNLGTLLILLGRSIEARDQFAESVRLQPDDAAFRASLGTALLQNKQFDEAIAAFRESVRREPRAEWFYQLSLAEMMRGDFTNATTSLRNTLTINSNFVAALNDLAWLLATAPEESIRKPHEAVTLALRACDLTKNQAASCLGTLDAAYAATGQFQKAIEVATQTAKLAESTGEKEILDLANERLALYRAGKPYRQSLSPSP